MGLKYLVVGTGGIGGITSAYLARAGKDVTMIARGESLAVIRKDGLHVQNPREEFKVKVKASSWKDYEETPDIVVLAIKGYSLEQVLPELDRVIGENTLILPLTNALDMAGKIREKLKSPCTVTGGVAYIVAEREKPGHIHHKLDFYSIVTGMPGGDAIPPELHALKRDFEEAGIEVLFRDNPVKSALRKFLRVSTYSAVCCYYEAPVGQIREDPEGLQLFKDLCQEILDIAEAMGEPFGKADEIPFPGLPVEEETLQLFQQVYPEYQPSMKLDWDRGHPTEIREQILDVIDLGEKYGLPMSGYRKVARGLISRKPEQVSLSDRKRYGAMEQ